MTRNRRRSSTDPSQAQFQVSVVERQIYEAFILQMVLGEQRMDRTDEVPFSSVSIQVESTKLDDFQMRRNFSKVLLDSATSRRTQT